MSIKTKIILSVVFVIFFFGVIATFFVFFQTKESLIELEKNNLKIIAKEHSEVLLEVFDDTWQLIDKISSLASVKEYLVGDKITLQDPRILQLFHDYNLGNNYSSIYVMNEEGRTLVSTNESFVGNDYSFRKYFQKSIQGDNFIDIAVGVTSGELGYYFSAPIKTDNEKIIGVIVAKLNPEHINSTLSVEKEDLHGISKIELLLIDSSGVVIHSNKKIKMYSSLGELNIQQKEEIEKNKKFIGKNILPLGYDEIQLKLNDIRNTQSFDIWDEIDFEQKIVVLSPVGDLPFFMLVEISQKDIFSSSFRVAVSLAGLVLLAAFFAIMVIYLFVAKILSPLQELKRTTDEISKGNLTERVVVSSKGELQELGESFNKMADKLVETQKDIEKKVKERTESLKKINNVMVDRELKMAELKEKIKYFEEKNKK